MNPNKVTSLSKIIAAVLFVMLPFLGFCLGIKYQQSITSLSEEEVVVSQLKSTKIYPTITPVITSVKKAAETANWKTYVNKQFSYSIKYPQDWKIENTTEGDKKVYISHIKQRLEKVLIIQIKENIKNAEEFIQVLKTDAKTGADNTQNDFVVKKQEKHTLGNISATKISGNYIYGIGNDNYYIFTVNNGKGYIIDFDDFNNEHKDMISTFNFLFSNRIDKTN